MKCLVLMVLLAITFIKCENQTQEHENKNSLEYSTEKLSLNENTKKFARLDENHTRVKRQFYYPYGYYRRPLPIIIGGFGVFGGGLGIGGRGFGGRGFGGRGFGGRGFGGQGFGGRGFGGRGFGGRGFGGRGFGGFGGRGIGGFGGRGGRG